MLPSSVIHLSSQLERTPNVLALRRQFGAEVFNGCAPDIKSVDRSSAAFLGCMRSHMMIAEAALMPTLVLESDAAPVNTSLEDVESLVLGAPDDCGILLLGGDVFEHGPVEDGYAEITGRFEGTQAIVFFSDRLHESHWFLHTYKHSFFNPVGGNVTLEQIYLDSCIRSGLKIYRPSRMRFSTIPAISARNGLREAPRTLNFNLE